MSVTSLIIGIISLFAIFVAFLPYLGFLHWFIVPLAVVGFFLGLAGRTQSRNKGLATVGVVLCSIALLVGLIKLLGFFDILV
ncbi:hypothetical protein DGWBC_1062 [Dehalogenimonas sp. WBC-2]|nr:hypothetical protein DGWBC_1062 [Dehalogenimonas sp. WBC-2]